MKFFFFFSETAFRQEKNLDQRADKVDFDLSQFQMARIFYVCSRGQTLYFTWKQKIGMLILALTQPHLSVIFTSIKNVRIDLQGLIFEL